MAAGAHAHPIALARTATAVGIPLYVVFGGIGLWIGTLAWNRFVCDDVLVPSVLGGPTAAVGATSALAAIVGIGGAVAIVDRRWTRAVRPRAAGVVQGGWIGLLAGLGPSALVVIGCRHVGAGIVLTAVALVLPSVLTGAVGVVLLRRVVRSPVLTVLFFAAKWVAVVVVALWLVSAFAPLERWTLVACA